MHRNEKTIAIYFENLVAVQPTFHEFAAADIPASMIVLGAIIGSALAFPCAWYLLRKRIEAAAKRSSKFSAIDSAIGQQGWKIVGLLRLSPVVPFNLSNYFYGITAVPSLDGETGHSPVKWMFLGLGLVATIAVNIIVSRSAKKALERSGAARARAEEENKA